MSSFREERALYLVPPSVTSNAIEARDVSFDPIPPAITSTNVQDAIEELANAPPPETPLKKPLVPGTSYGISDQTTQSETCGFGTFALKATASTAQFLNVSALGHQIFPALVAAFPMTNSMFLGSSYTANALTGGQRNFIATNGFVANQITGLNRNIIIAPSLGGVVPGPSARVIQDLIAISPSTVSLPTGSGTIRPVGLINSVGAVTMGNQCNMVLNSGTGPVAFQQQNDNSTGFNQVFSSTNGGYSFTDVRSGCIIHNANEDDDPIQPTRDDQFVCSAKSYRLNLQESTTPAQIISNYRNLVFDQTSYLLQMVAYSSTSAIPEERFGSRHWAQRATVNEITPGVLSTATFTLPSLSIMTNEDLTNAVFNLTVRVNGPTNQSNTKFYTTQVQNINIVTRVLTANVYETDITTGVHKNATGSLTVGCTFFI